MYTILHAADVHLDRAYSGTGMTSSIASARRQELRDAFRRFIDEALEIRVDAVTIGGDLYEHERSTLDTGNFLRQQFERLGPVPVLIATGNHDPYLPDSLYKRIDWPANVNIFREPQFRSVQLADGVTIWGAGHNAPDVRQNLLDGLRVPDGGIHVLLFHGSDLSSVPEGKPVHCGFRPEDIERTGAHFALLGHYHSAKVRERFAYPGSLEALDFSEAGDHHALRLDIDGTIISTQLVPIGRARYTTERVDVTPMTSSEELRTAIASLGEPGAIVRVVLEGDLQPEVDLDITALYNACVERFQFLDLVDRTHPAWRLEEIAEESTTKGAFVRLMQARIESLIGEPAEVAEMALALGLQAFERREVRTP
jgi:DNA repair exonuclease SbcCD nuclease subunit